jgi:hypothetical protein
MLSSAHATQDPPIDETTLKIRVDAKSQSVLAVAGSQDNKFQRIQARGTGSAHVPPNQRFKSSSCETNSRRGRSTLLRERSLRRPCENIALVYAIPCVS